MWKIILGAGGAKNGARNALARRLKDQENIKAADVLKSHSRDELIGKKGSSE